MDVVRLQVVQQLKLLKCLVRCIRRPVTVPNSRLNTLWTSGETLQASLIYGSRALTLAEVPVALL